MKKKNPMSVLDIYTKTPLGKALSTTEQADRENIGRLMDIAYIKRAIPFSNFGALCSMEKKHGVSLGCTCTYQNDVGCNDMVMCIGQCIENELKKALAEAKYFSILMDGSTDCSAVESELMYIIYISKDGDLTQSFLKLTAVNDASAAGLGF